MKIKADFITNSSSTNYIVEEFFAGEVTDHSFYGKFSELVKKFFDCIQEIYKDSDSEPNKHLQLKAKVDDGYMQFEAGNTDTDMVEVRTSNDVYLYGLITDIESIGSSLNITFKYTANQKASELDTAMKFMVRQLFQDVFEVDEISVRHTRSITEFHGDGWDGGDPCFGHYGETELCKEEVEIKESIIM